MGLFQISKYPEKWKYFTMDHGWKTLWIIGHIPLLEPIRFLVASYSSLEYFTHPLSISGQCYQHSLAGKPIRKIQEKIGLHKQDIFWGGFDPDAHCDS